MLRTSRARRLAMAGALAVTASLASTLPADAITATSAPALALPLSVQGNRIVDAAGQTVVLRGLQRDGTQGEEGTWLNPVTPAELGWMGFQQPGSWHATVVRVPLGSAQWTGACPNLANDPYGYRAMIDAEVQALNAQGILALLELHTSTAGCTSIRRHAMPDAPISQQFWYDVATRYRDNKLVAFELYNEPHFVTDETWLLGGDSVQDCDVTAPITGTYTQRMQQKWALARCQASAPKYKAAGMQSLYDIVAAQAPGHLIVVDGNAWARSPSTRPVNAWAGNLVLGMHPYTCTIPGSSCDTSSQAAADTRLLDSWVGPSATQPVFATEMGWPVHRSNTDPTYIEGSNYYRETLAYLQRQSPPWGFVAFAFNGSKSGSFTLITDTTTYAPNSTGKPVYDLLRAAPTG